ncbi:3-ketoacyl-CoA thiolase, mitochondrial [Nymphon striatum]|nr:3-ketoacyl-CoA thiolase, mitochondrial [Nymphon striatum]
MNMPYKVHLRLVAAMEADSMEEIEAIYDDSGKMFNVDDGVRPDSSVEKIAKLKPFFDRPYGKVTPANSSQITDGATSLIVASEDAVKKYKLSPIAQLSPAQWAGLDPAQMGLGPAHAIVETLKYHHLIMENIDYWEINEAFAAQVQACVLALNDPDYCKGELGLLKEAGQIPMDRLNVDGGAIALGHPVGSSGARIVLHLAHVLKRENAKKGIASLCIGGGQDELVWLTLDVKDEAANVINPDVVEELSAACDEVKTMSGIKGMIIHSGKTSGFIAGADVKKFTEVTDTTQALGFIHAGQAACQKIEDLPIPTVAMVQGFCMGGGLEIALACDYIVTDDAPSTKLSLPEVKLGIHPGFGGTVRSIRRMGVLAAMPLMLNG